MIAPRLFGWDIHQNDTFFLTFLVAVHLATALVLLGFLHDWVRIVKGFFRTIRDRGIDPADADARLAWLLIAGTIPAGILGLALERPLRKLFASPEYAAVFLIINGLLLFGAERLRRRAPRRARARDRRGLPDRPPDELPPSRRRRMAQALALIPGISRSGVTMGGGLLAGLNNRDAARFGFLRRRRSSARRPVLKLPELFGHDGDGVRGPALVAALCAAGSAFLSIRFLMRFFETNTLTPFAIYCVVAGPR